MGEGVRRGVGLVFGHERQSKVEMISVRAFTDLDHSHTATHLNSDSTSSSLKLRRRKCTGGL